MKRINDTLRLGYETPRVETFSIASEGILCDSAVDATTETGATWIDEIDASLQW